MSGTLHGRGQRPAPRRPRWRRAAALAAAALAAAPLAAGCAGAGPAAPDLGRSRTIYVVASENFWGSIAGQLGGAHVRVYSLVSDPNVDPHEFEATAAAARAIAEANYVIQNGAGYDDWMAKLMSASPNPRRLVLDIGQMLGKRPGENPHLWYDPRYVTAAMNRIEADYKRLDPEDAAYFTARRAAVDAAFAGVRARLAEIKRLDSGKPVASTESIIVYLARYLGLKVISPPAFMNAVSQGNPPPAASVALFARQLAGHQAEALVYNAQTATALTTSMRELAVRHHIPVVAVTETIQPPNESYQRWFAGQLAALGHALTGGA